MMIRIWAAAGTRAKFRNALVSRDRSNTSADIRPQPFDHLILVRRITSDLSDNRPGQASCRTVADCSE
jgi:hypothetical protein